MSASMALELQAQAQELSELIKHIELDHSVFIWIFLCCSLILHELILELKPIFAEISPHLAGAAPPATIPIQNKEREKTMQKSHHESPIWKDVTSYQRGKERKPTTFEAKVGALRVVITCGHAHYQNQWVMHCKTLSVDTYRLEEGIDFERAKAEAILIIEERIADLEKCLAKIKNENQ